MRSMHLREPLTLQQRVWNMLIPKRAVQVEVTKEGVSFIHSTKGPRFVSAKRFAAHGAPLDA